MGTRNAPRTKRKAIPRNVREAPSIQFGADLAIQDYRFGNGLRLLALPDRSAPVVSYQTWVRVGSRHEAKGKTGLAHLLEHLMFKETSRHPAGDFDRLLELEGAEVNAATWTDWTCYFENLPRGSLPVAIELEADRLNNLVLHEEQIESERSVVINERQSSVEDDVEARAGEALYAMALRSHPYRWPTIGWMSDIKNLRVEDCRRFYRTFYAPNNVTLVVAGDFDSDDLLRQVHGAYGRLKRTRVPREKSVSEPKQRRPRQKTMRLDTDTPKLLYGWRGAAYGTSDYIALTVVSELLTGGRSSRLRWRLVTEEEVAVSVSSDIAPFAQAGLFDILVDGREGTTHRTLIRGVDAELKRLREHGPTAEELETAKNRLELGTLTTLETASGKADQIGFDAMVCGAPAATFDFLGAYERITAEDCRDAARRYLSPEQGSRIHVLPKGRRS